MTDLQPDEIPVADIDTPETPSDALDRQADALLARNEGRTFPPQPLHRAVQEDADAAREWGRTRVRRLRGAVEEEPVKASIYALGLGVVIGLLIAR